MANSFLHIFRTLDTRGYHGHSIKFSPFDEDILAVSGAENFGIKGSGSLIFYNLSAKYPITKKFTYYDAIFDLCWMKSDSDVVLTGSGDGCIQIWCTNKPIEVPLSCIKVHNKEVSSIECCKYHAEYFTSSSWDSTVVLCEINSSQPSCVLRGHNGMVYEAIWARTGDRILASVSEDGRALIWSPFTSPKPNLSSPPIGAELLSCDWSYTNSNILVTASTNAVLYGWDLRSFNSPVFQLKGHDNAIRKVRFSPFISNEIASVSYDFTTRLWDASSGIETSGTRSHSEFVYGVDYSLLRPGIIADCSWDQSIQIYRIGLPPPATPLSAIENRASTPTQPLHYASSSSSFSRPLPPIPPEASQLKHSYPLSSDAHRPKRSIPDHSYPTSTPLLHRQLRSFTPYQSSVQSNNPQYSLFADGSRAFLPQPPSRKARAQSPPRLPTKPGTSSKPLPPPPNL